MRYNARLYDVHFAGRVRLSTKVRGVWSVNALSFQGEGFGKLLCSKHVIILVATAAAFVFAKTARAPAMVHDRDCRRKAVVHLGRGWDRAKQGSSNRCRRTSLDDLTTVLVHSHCG